MDSMRFEFGGDGWVVWVLRAGRWVVDSSYVPASWQGPIPQPVARPKRAADTMVAPRE